MSKADIGNQMKSIYKWTWLTVFFFWFFLIPPIVLIIKYWSLPGVLKANGLHAEGSRLGLSIILTIIPLGITQLIGLILMFLWYGDMQSWATSQRLTQAAAGFSQCKTAMLISLIPLGITQFIGFLMFLFGYPKAYNGLL